MLKKGELHFMNFKNLTMPRKLILGAGVLAIISLFLPWVDLGIISASGFQQQGYFFLVFFIYPFYCIFKDSKINKIGGLISGGLAIIATIFFISSKTEVLFGETINAAGIGMYTFLISAIILAIAVFLDKK